MLRAEGNDRASDCASILAHACPGRHGVYDDHHRLPHPLRARTAPRHASAADHRPRPADAGRAHARAAGGAQFDVERGEPCARPGEDEPRVEAHRRARRHHERARRDAHELGGVDAHTTVTVVPKPEGTRAAREERAAIAHPRGKTRASMATPLYFPPFFRVERRVVLVGPDGNVYTDLESAWRSVGHKDAPGLGEDVNERMSSDLEQLVAAAVLCAKADAESTDDLSSSLVGQRVSVYWKHDRRTYLGTISDQDATSGHVHVIYDDGDEYWESEWSSIATCRRALGCPKPDKHVGRCPCASKKRARDQPVLVSSRKRLTTRKLGANDGWGDGCARNWCSS